jgi:cytochrome P450
MRTVGEILLPPWSTIGWNQTLAIWPLEHVKLFSANNGPFWAWSLLVSVGLCWLLWYYEPQRRKRLQERLYGMPVVQDSPEGSAYPLLGHGLTFWRNAPWDLLTKWHFRSTNNRTRDYDATTTSTTTNDGADMKYQPIICFPLLGTTYFSVASPSLCKAILQSHVAHVHKDVQVTMKPFLSILGTGLVSSEGSHWLQQRMHVSQALRQDILECIPWHTLNAIQRLCHATLDPAAASSTGTTTATDAVPLGSLLRHLTLQVISGAFLSLTADESDAHFAVLYLPIVDEANRRVWHPYRTYCVWTLAFWRYHCNVYRLNAYVSRLIRQRWTLRRREQEQTNGVQRRQQRRGDILDTVLRAYEDKYASGCTKVQTVLPSAVIRQVRDEMKTFMLAGHETSAAMMTWTLYELVLSRRNAAAAAAASRTDGSTNGSATNGTGTSPQPNLLDQVVTEADTVFDSTALIDDWKRTDYMDDDPSGGLLPHPNRLALLVMAEACLKVRVCVSARAQE